FSVTGGEQFVIEIQENAVGSENTFTVTDENGTTIASGGPFVDFFTDFALDNHQYDLCLPSGNYTFTINDAGGDGLLATFGAADQGYYRITQNGTEIATEDDFGSQDVVNFSSAGTGINADFDVTVNGLSVTVSDISTGGTIVSQDWEATGAATESGTGSSFTTTYANSGTYSITLYVKTANGCEAITKSVTITNGGGNGGGGGVGINDVNIYNLSIYPNPSNGMINITFDSSEKLSLSIINTVGAVVSDYGSISNNERIDINHLAGGIYFVKLQGEKGTSIQRLIVK
ncbi:MAG: T9SS type A sorting domain-containing protein, partial [Chitinophagales bacterium]